MPLTTGQPLTLPDLERIPERCTGMFEKLARVQGIHSFGVPYVLVKDDELGELYVTRYGWHCLEELLPAEWFTNRRYRTEGHRLPGSTGTVYFVPRKKKTTQPVDLVVKFSRFAEDIPLHVSTIPSDVAPSLFEDEIFNSPFEEFGVVMDLRRARYGPPELRIRTKRPLAILCPPAKHPLWRLGRKQSQFKQYVHQMNRDQQHERSRQTIELEIEKQYIMLYQWIDGMNAEDMFSEGIISEEDMLRLTRRVTRELNAKGFYVIDNKPKHYILRLHPQTRRPLHRNDRLVYALIDFELLKRTTMYEAHLRRKQRQRPTG